ncbi:MAG: tetratricopeptide repeat protein [Acidobacteriota bacterium]|nr:tetratricopeptide repeat protein [Acidobacteriota bacterium]
MSLKSVVVLFVWILLGDLACVSQTAGDRLQFAEHSKKAQEYLRQNNPALAIPEFEALVTLNPGDMDARANLGVLLYFQGKYVEAIPQLRAAVTDKPDLWKIRYLLGIAERRVGDEQDGRVDLEAVFPNLADEKLKITVGRNLIESYAGSEDLDKASDMIAVLLKLEPTNPSLLYTSYRIHSEMATSAMLELGVAAPNSAQIHQAIAHETQRDRDLSGTIANLREALALDPALPGIHFELAEAMRASDDQALRAQAEAEYKLAIESNPGDVKALTRMGDVQVEKGNFDSAAQYYKMALKFRPTASDALIGLANVLSEKDQPTQALPLLLQVEAADPTNSLAHFRLSTIYRKLHKPDDVKREIALYLRFKGEREKLNAIYKQLRVLTPQNAPEK